MRVQMLRNVIGNVILPGAGHSVKAQHQRLRRQIQPAIMGPQRRHQLLVNDMLTKDILFQIATEC